MDMPSKYDYVEHGYLSASSSLSTRWREPRKIAATGIAKAGRMEPISQQRSCICEHSGQHVNSARGDGCHTLASEHDIRPCENADTTLSRETQYELCITVRIAYKSPLSKKSPKDEINIHIRSINLQTFSRDQQPHFPISLSTSPTNRSTLSPATIHASTPAHRSDTLTGLRARLLQHALHRHLHRRFHPSYRTLGCSSDSSRRQVLWFKNPYKPN